MSLKVDIFQILNAPTTQRQTHKIINCWPLGELNMISKKCGFEPDTVKKKNTGKPVMTTAWILPCTVRVCRFFSIFLRSRVLLTIREKMIGKLPPVSRASKIAVTICCMAGEGMRMIKTVERFIQRHAHLIFT